MRCTILVLSLALVAMVSCSQPAPLVPPHMMSPKASCPWDISEMKSAALSGSFLPSNTTILEARVLAWHEIVSIKSFVGVYDESLLWLRINVGSSTKWALAWLIRTPHGEYHQWRYSLVLDADRPPCMVYEIPPRNKDVYWFLQLGSSGPGSWPFKPIMELQLIKCGVDQHEWNNAIGETPTMFYDLAPIPYFTEGRDIH